METKMELTKDEEADEVDVHLYRSMIVSISGRRLFDGNAINKNSGYPLQQRLKYELASKPAVGASNVDSESNVGLCKLQLADVSGISMLPNPEIFEGMGNMGYPRDGQVDQAVDQPSSSAPLPSSSHPPVLYATIESKPTPVTDPPPHPTSPSPDPDSEPIEHTFEQPSPEHQPLLPRQETEVPQSQEPTHSHVAEERTMSVDDLLQLVPKLLTKVDSLETELQQTKLTMGKALVKLVKKVKKMEDVLKRRHVVLPDSEDEDADISSKQGRNLQEEGLDEND
ncbi:hypothetical protein Tco_0795495 [Tanacetum coccineum]